MFCREIKKKSFSVSQSHSRSTLITFRYTLSALEWQTTTATRGVNYFTEFSCSCRVCCFFFCITCENRREKYMKRSCCVMKIPLIQKQIFDIDFSSLSVFTSPFLPSSFYFCWFCSLCLPTRFVIVSLVALCSGPGQKNTLSVTKTFLRGASEHNQGWKTEASALPHGERRAKCNLAASAAIKRKDKHRIPRFSDLISPSNPSIAWLKEFQLWNARIFNIEIRRNWFSFHKREEATFRAKATKAKWKQNDAEFKLAKLKGIHSISLPSFSLGSSLLMKHFLEEKYFSVYLRTRTRTNTKCGGEREKLKEKINNSL